MGVRRYGNNSPSSVTGGGLKGLTREAPRSKVECQIPGVSLNGVLEGKFPDVVRVGSGLSGRSGEGGTNERDSNSNKRSLHADG